MKPLGSRQVVTRPRRFYQRLGFLEAVEGWLFVAPAVLGLVIFNAIPVVASFGLSFTKYDIVSAPTFVGLDNYVGLLTRDRLFGKSAGITLQYAALSIPLSVLVAYIIALLMSQEVRGIGVYRTLWYLPSLVPAVVTGALWGWLLNKEFGPINYPLKLLGLPAPGWLVDPEWVVPSLVLIRLWAMGNAVLIFLAGLKGVPEHLYEAATVDGANWWHKFRHVTLPMTSSIIFFNLVMNIIGAFQVFSVVFVIYSAGRTGQTAGPANSALVYVLYLYRNAFAYFRNGYACAMAWILFMVIMALTFLAFRTQKLWVYYETELPE
jgi:multiple sugar transport system permease protein